MEDIIKVVADSVGGLNALQMYLFLGSIGLALFTSIAFKGAYNKYSRIANARGLTGFEAASMMLNKHNVDTQIVCGNRVLGDNYNPRNNTITLSKDVYHGRSIASIAIACHEVGHAIQYATRYSGIRIRNKLLPVVQISSSLSWMVIMIGIFASMTSILLGGIALLGVILIFQMLTLPVEFNASSRAKEYLFTSGIAINDENTGVSKILRAAAMTYVVAVITTLMTMARLLLIVYQQNNRR